MLTVVDGADLVTTAYTATGTQPLMISGLKLHSLPRGAKFDLTTRTLISAPGLPGDEPLRPPVTTLDDVPAGTRPQSRRIAAEGAHVTTEQLRRR